MVEIFYRWRIPLLCLLTIVGISSALLTRIALESSTELTLARNAVQQNQPSSAVLHYRRAIRWYFPGNPSVAKAVRELREVALAAEESKQIIHAVTAWTGLYGGLRAIRSFYQPYPREIGEAAAHLSRHLSSVAVKEQFKTDITPRINRLEEEFSNERRADPNLIGVICLLVGFSLWVTMMLRIASGKKPLHNADATIQALPNWVWGLACFGWLLFFAGTWLL